MVGARWVTDPRRRRRYEAYRHSLATTGAAVALVTLLAAGGCSAEGPAPAVEGPARTVTGRTAPSPAPPEVTIAFSGDLLVHDAVADRARAYARDSRRTGGDGDGVAYDFDPMLEPVRTQLSAADLAVCHVETPLSPDNSRISGYPIFNAPRELADAIRYTGYDACTTASNHAFDQGMPGVIATLDQLDRAGVAHAGTARTPEDTGRITLLPADTATVALLDYTFGANEGQFPPPWAVATIDAARIRAGAGRARASGADLVVVVLHWGEEYRTAPTTQQQELAGELLGSPDVDLVVGGHAHVVQPVQRIGGKFVVYGVGNFLSNQSAECCVPNSQDGVIATAHARRDGTGRWTVDAVTLTPTWVERGSYRVLPVAATLDDPAIPEPLRRELSASWRRTTAALDSLGPADGAHPDRVPRSLAN